MKYLSLALTLLVSVACSNSNVPSATGNPDLLAAKDSKSIVKEDSPLIKSMKADLAHCTSENPPQTYSTKLGTLVLDLCGKQMDYLAIPFEEENFILFVNYTYKDTEFFPDTITLHTVTTVEPYEIATLGSLSNPLPSPLTLRKTNKDIEYFYERIEDAGLMQRLFVFNPKTKEYLYGMRRSRDCEETVEIGSSAVFSSSEMTKIEEGCSFMGLRPITLADDDIMVSYNDEVYFSKLDVENGSADDLMPLFNCFVPDITSLSEDQIYGLFIEANDFPTQFPCGSTFFDIIVTPSAVVDVQQETWLQI